MAPDGVAKVRMPAERAAFLAWYIVAGASMGLLAFQAWLPETQGSLALENRMEATSRHIGLWVVLASAGIAMLFGIRAWKGADAVGYWIRPLAIAFLLPPLASSEVWRAEPMLSMTLAIGAAVFLTWVLIPERTSALESAGRTLDRKRRPLAVVLWLLILGYAFFVAFATIRQHQLLETRAYDMGIMENVFWHTTEGRFFDSSLEGRNHLGVHTSFIYLFLVPIYNLVPRPETLLVAQAFLIALAAWPLFLLVRTALRSDGAAALLAALYLLQPSVQGANFYDFHELAFAPVLFFSAAYALISDRRPLLWTSIILLLLVKEDCAFIVAGLGLLAFLERRARTGWILLGSAGLALVLFQWVVIPHFARGESSFAWYYTGMIPEGEGPLGLVKTVLLNPVFSIRQAMSVPKVLYVMATLGPVLFLCLAGWRGGVLVAYGLAISLFASRGYLYEMGFQYSLQLIPGAFTGAVLVLAARTSIVRRLGISLSRALASMTLVTAFLAFHAGMLSPFGAFRSGFRIVSHTFGETERERFREVQEVAKRIPRTSSVTASETLVPHVARRKELQTLRYAADSFGRYHDYFFILKTDLDPGTKVRYRYVLASPEYRLVHEGTYTLLFQGAHPR